MLEPYRPPHPVPYDMNAAVRNTMPLRFGQLGLWFLATYAVVLRLRHLLRSGSWDELLRSYSSVYHFSLQLTGLLAFGAYSVGAYYLLYRAYGRIGRVRLVAAFLLLTLACMLFRAFLEEGVLFAVFGNNNYHPDLSWRYYLLDNLYYATLFLPVGIVFFFVQRGRYVDAVRYRMESAYREAELKFLRSQVNPHFLFNTINNVYALVSTQDPQALPALEKLSGLLRYSLYAQDDRIPVAHEWRYLQDLIHLEFLRVPAPATPEMALDAKAAEWLIPPLLLVPLVENACKHGRLDQPGLPLSVVLTADDRSLDCTVINAVRPAGYRPDAEGGIGLVNVRKRLELLYPGRHTLHTQRKDGVFRATLTLQRDPV